METSTRGRNPANGLDTRTCPVCGNEYAPYRDPQRACSRKCRETLGPVPESERKYPVEIVCRKCERVSTRYSTIRGGRFYFCTDCEGIASRERQGRKNAARRVDPDRSQKTRKSNLKRTYGISPADYDQMLDAQGGVCLICGDPPKVGGVQAASKLHVDHDHSSGRVRGLLCNHCNRGLGAFRDRPELLEAAIAYLKT